MHAPHRPADRASSWAPGWVLPGQLALLAALATLAALVPGTRFWTLVATNWAAAALVVDGVRRFRPQRRVTWWVAAAFLALVAAGNTVLLVVGQDSTLVLVLTASAQVAAAAAVPGLFRGTDRRRAVVSPGRVLDLGVLLLVVGLAAAQLAQVGAAHHRTTGLAWPLVLAPALDVVLLGVLAWTVLSRTRLVPAMVLLVAAGVLCLAYDLLCTASGHRVARPGDPLEVLGVVNMSLFGLAAQQPSMALLGSTSAPTRPRRSWVQLLLLVPFALAPACAVGVAALGAPLPLPTAVLAGVAVLVLLAVVARAVIALHETELSAERDALTGLLNRRGLARAFARATGRPLASGEHRWLLLVDLDDFKQVNDRYGHGTGDALLLVVADRLTAAVGRRGLVARQGGDEFIVVTTTGAGEQPPEEALLGALGRPAAVRGLHLPVSASLGVLALDGPRGAVEAVGTRSSTGSADLDQLLADADIAMYAAKRAAKGTAATFHPQLRTRLLDQLAATEDLRALLSDCAPTSVGDLRVHYQPIVDLADGRVVGAEALVRWHHPRRGLVSPDEFLVLAEREGLGSRLDQVVLDAALAQLARWDADGTTTGPGRAPLFLSVNLGLSGTCDPTMPRWVADAAAVHGVAPGRVHVEITEHDALPDDERIASALHEVVGAGFELSLDDFGVGYTSLSYLARFPITTLKLDRSLVGGAGTGEQSLVAAIAAMTRSLGLTLLAEGVEAPEQAEALRRTGVHLAQGYHYARPLPADEFAALVRAQAVPQAPLVSSP